MSHRNIAEHQLLPSVCTDIGQKERHVDVNQLARCRPSHAYLVAWGYRNLASSRHAIARLFRISDPFAGIHDVHDVSRHAGRVGIHV